MIAKILSSGSSFNGVNYNSTKIEKGDGELMLVANFGSLQGLPNLRPEDYKNYLKMISATNSRIKNPQFHAAISCKGTEYSKDELTAFAVDWMKKMGYGSQPFLVVFHSDTENNHVHLVSTRINQNTGKKINDSFERLRTYDAIQSILNLESSLTIDLEKAKEFKFSTEAQFKLLLEKQGYTLKSDSDKIDIIKYGKVQGSIDRNEIQLLTKERDNKRIAQIKAIILKYQCIYSSELSSDYTKSAGGLDGKLVGYRSHLSDHLKEKFGLDIVYHFSGEKQPYGYTLIDNSNRNVFKGSEIMPLKDLVQNLVILDANWLSITIKNIKEEGLGVDQLDSILKQNGFYRRDLTVFDKENEEAFKVQRDDFIVLSTNTKNRTSYKVHSEKDKIIIGAMLNIPVEQISIAEDTSIQQIDKDMYSTLLLSAMHNYSTIEEGLESLNISLLRSVDRIYLFDSANNVFIDLDMLVDQDNKNILMGSFLDLKFDPAGLESIGLEDHFLASEIENSTYSGSFNPFIADDVDDEKVHGRNRRKKGKSVTTKR